MLDSTFSIQAPASPCERPFWQKDTHHSNVLAAQKGVVLIIALILLVIISLLAVTSIRNVGSTATVLGNVRTTELATQSADIALRYCETRLQGFKTSGTNTPTTPAAGAAPLWQDVAGQWDSAATNVVQVPLSKVNQTALITTFQRPPECMVEGILGNANAYVVTARGFGPEVPALADNSTRVRPVGSEVWLQSTISY